MCVYLLLIVITPACTHRPHRKVPSLSSLSYRSLIPLIYSLTIHLHDTYSLPPNLYTLYTLNALLAIIPPNTSNTFRPLNYLSLLLIVTVQNSLPLLSFHLLPVTFLSHEINFSSAEFTLLYDQFFYSYASRHLYRSFLLYTPLTNSI